MPPPLVLLHGALGNAAQLGALADAFGGNAVLPDLDGHGARPETPYDLAAFVQTALAGEEPVDLVGYSLGGYVALAAAIARPDRVRRVVAIATKLAWTPELAAAETRRLDPDRLVERAPAFVDELAARHPGPGWRAVLTHTSDFLSGLGTAEPLDLARVTCPVLLLVGADDALVTYEECAAAVDALPDGRLVVLPGTPHPYERMSPELLAREIGPFLQD